MTSLLCRTNDTTCKCLDCPGGQQSCTAHALCPRAACLKEADPRHCNDCMIASKPHQPSHRQAQQDKTLPITGADAAALKWAVWEVTGAHPRAPMPGTQRGTSAGGGPGPPARTSHVGLAGAMHHGHGPLRSWCSLPHWALQVRLAGLGVCGLGDVHCVQWRGCVYRGHTRQRMPSGPPAPCHRQIGHGSVQFVHVLVPGAGGGGGAGAFEGPAWPRPCAPAAPPPPPALPRLRRPVCTVPRPTSAVCTPPPPLNEGRGVRCAPLRTAPPPPLLRRRGGGGGRGRCHRGRVSVPVGGYAFAFCGGHPPRVDGWGGGGVGRSPIASGAKGAGSETL